MRRAGASASLRSTAAADDAVQAAGEPARLPPPLVWALGVGLALRWGIALLTEFHPIFPEYYYTDASLIDRLAQSLSQAWIDGTTPIPNIEPSWRMFTALVGGIYYAAGPVPLLPKLLNGLLSVATIYLWTRLALLCAEARAATAACWMLALWPSHVFFASQSFRDPLALLLAAAALYIPLKEWASGRPLTPGRPWLWVGAILAVGLCRPYMTLFAAGALLVGGAAAAWAARRERQVSLGIAASCMWFLIAGAVYRPVANYFYAHFLSAGVLSEDDIRSRASLFPETQRRGEGYARPLSPQGITEFRRLRQWYDRHYAQHQMGRSIETQILPEAEFHTWGEVAAFLPKGMLYSMFMPLPGLYPMDGKLGRVLASLENTVLLVVTLLALWGWTLGARTPAGWTLGVFFVLAAASYGLLEFDLGAATRHRLQYLPCLFPFAAAALLRLWDARRGARA